MDRAFRQDLPSDPVRKRCPAELTPLSIQNQCSVIEHTEIKRHGMLPEFPEQRCRAPARHDAKEIAALPETGHGSPVTLSYCPLSVQCPVKITGQKQHISSGEA